MLELKETFNWDNIRDGLGLSPNEIDRYSIEDLGICLKYSIRFKTQSKVSIINYENGLKRHFSNVLDHYDINFDVYYEHSPDLYDWKTINIEISKAPEVKMNQKFTENDAKKIKFGNISFNDFLNGIGISTSNILKYSMDTIHNERIIQSEGWTKAMTKNYDLKLTMDIVTTNRFNTNGKLPKISKHSRKYDITLLKAYDIGKTFGEDYYTATLEYYFKYNAKYKKPNTINYPLISVDTIKNIVGLSQIHYKYVSNKVFNNGWKYVYHLFDDSHISKDYQNILKIVEKLEASKSLNDYYKKVFIDANDDLQIIILKKNHKSFYHNGIPKLNNHHIWSILGINSYDYGNCIIRKYNDGYSLNIIDDEYRQELYPYDIKEKLESVFGDYYELTLEDTGDNQTYIIFENLDDTNNFYDDSSDGLKQLLKSKVEFSILLAASRTLLQYMIKHNHSIYTISRDYDFDENEIRELLYENVASSEIVGKILKNLG